MPDLSEIRPTYNDAGLLEAVDARIRNASVWTPFVTGISYDAKGRRERIDYGNTTFTEYTYDPLSFRLTRLQTKRLESGGVHSKLQDLFYFYDPVGNITTIRDEAQQEVFFAGQQVTPKQEFLYDAIYRLIGASGREHAGGVGDNQRDNNDLPLWNLPHPNDAQALRRYEEAYEYDAVGNILKMIHTAVGSSAGSWTRRYAYGSNGVVPGGAGVPPSNRLHSTSLPGDAANGPYTAAYTHDLNGNITAFPHLANVEYTHSDQMRVADLGGGGTAYYTYDAGGERVRKVIQRIGTTREERIYLGGWELYRKRQGASQEVVLERETLHLMDDTRRIAMVETKTIDADVPGTLPIVSRIRHQYSNHLDSAHLECDESGLVISYEECHPYGTPAYRSAKSGVEVSEKRFRYTGKERDDETGFQYHSARYYAPWLGRWTTADPAGMVDGPCLFAYVGANPLRFSDPSGLDSFPGIVGEGRCPMTVTYPNYDALAAGSARGDFTINSDGSYTATQMVPCAPPTNSTPSAPKAPTPKKAPAAPKPVDQTSIENLRRLAGALAPQYHYQPSVHRVFGLGQMIGGGLEAAGGVVALLTPEPTMATKVAGGVVIAHGADQAATGFEQLLSGKPTHTYTFRLSAYVAQSAGMNAEDASAIGRISDQLFGIAAGGAGLGIGGSSSSAIGTTGTTSTMPTATMYRFATRSAPATLQSNLSRAGWFTRARVNFMMRFESYARWRADMHMRGYTKNSPFISMIEDPSALANSTDPWARTITTGKPGMSGVLRAPDLGEFSVPTSQMYWPLPDNLLSIAETEVLFHGRDLAPFLVQWQANPF
ncbi:MAG: RHS repeat-associated core domain-containing protein [Polyangiaceae bacterium]|nr:RHS repeat-associated core domain-containing protein [Polyangiaceae bacterium]